MLETGGQRRTCSERGASGIEYAMLLVLSALLVTLTTSAVVTHSDLAGRTAAAVCRILDGSDCDATGEQVESALERALGGDFVAMGDSFASGEGAGDYREGTNFDRRDDWNWDNWGDDDHNRCRRSTSAYAERVFADNTFQGGLTATYCSGARMGAEVDDDTDDDTEGGAIFGANPDNTGEGPQIDALDDDTSLVTMSIGGNDLGFGDVLSDCAINGERGVPGIAQCQDTWDATLDERIAALKPQLVALYTDMRERAPNARIVIMGYPRLFHDPPSEPLSNLLFVEDQLWMNGKADALNAMLREAAREARVEFIDPTNAFIGHGVGSDDPWINDLDWGGPGLALFDPSSFHPNATGHAAMAELLQDQLENPRYP